MVDLTSKADPYQHGFSNSVFILPAIIVIGLSGEIPIFVPPYSSWKILGIDEIRANVHFTLAFHEFNIIIEIHQVVESIELINIYIILVGYHHSSYWVNYFIIFGL